MGTPKWMRSVDEYPARRPVSLGGPSSSKSSIPPCRASQLRRSPGPGGLGMTWTSTRKVRRSPGPGGRGMTWTSTRSAPVSACEGQSHEEVHLQLPQQARRRWPLPIEGHCAHQPGRHLGSAYEVHHLHPGRAGCPGRGSTRVVGRKMLLEVHALVRCLGPKRWPPRATRVECSPAPAGGWRKADDIWATPSRDAACRLRARCTAARRVSTQPLPSWVRTWPSTRRS